MKYKILSLAQSSCFHHQDPYVFISISDVGVVGIPPVRRANRNMGNCLAVIPLDFWDIDPLGGGVNGTHKNEYNFQNDEHKSGLFNNIHAQLIVDFYLEWKDKVEFIAIHCHAGISRSSGVAVALQMLSDGSGSEQWIYDHGAYVPNRWVVETILNNATRRKCFSNKWWN